MLFNRLLGRPSAQPAIADTSTPTKAEPNGKPNEPPGLPRRSSPTPPDREQPEPQPAEPEPGQELGKLEPGSPVQKNRNWFVCYPANGQSRVPLTFPGNELPDPLPDTEEKLAGYPVTVTFARQHAITGAQAELLDQERQVVPVWLSSPEKPANPRYKSEQGNTICLIARQPLRPGCKYTVSVSARVDGRDWKHGWSFVTISSAEQRRVIEKEVLDRINYYRKLCRLEPVTIDPEKSTGCMAHARYLALNVPKHPDINWYSEDMQLPGASPEGQQVASRSTILLGGGATGVVDWMTGFLNRQQLLEPNLRSVGVGFTPLLARGYAWVLHARADRRVGAVGAALVFPADGQKEVPLGSHMRTNPKPYPASHHDREVGFAITAVLPDHAMPSGLTARLTDSSGKEIAFWLSTQDRPAIADPRFHQAWIGLVPQLPLQQGVTYTVHLEGTLEGKPWQKTWSFTAMSLDETTRSRLAKRLVDALNRSRRLAGLEPVELDQELSKACDLHCRYCVKNFKHPRVQGLGQHDEDLTLEGATPEGQKAGRASVIANDPSPEESVDGWLSTLYHRLPLLHPSLKRVGFGIARLPNQNFMIMLDSGSDVRGR